MRVVREVLTTMMAVVALITALTMVGGAAASAAPAAAAATCPPSPEHKINGDGLGLVGYGTHSIRNGPGVGCNPIANLPEGTQVWFWCKVENSSGNTWWWVRVNGQSTSGWLYEGNILAVDIWDDNGDGVIEIRHC